SSRGVVNGPTLDPAATTRDHISKQKAVIPNRPTRKIGCGDTSASARTIPPAVTSTAAVIQSRPFVRRWPDAAKPRPAASSAATPARFTSEFAEPARGAPSSGGATTDAETNERRSKQKPAALACGCLGSADLNPRQERARSAAPRAPAHNGAAINAGAAGLSSTA